MKDGPGGRLSKGEAIGWVRCMKDLHLKVKLYMACIQLPQGLGEIITVGNLTMKTSVGHPLIDAGGNSILQLPVLWQLRNWRWSCELRRHKPDKLNAIVCRVGPP